MAVSARPEHWKLDPAAVEAFKASLRGQLIEPEDAGYETARRVYNAMIDKRPALIARCANVADVIRSVDFARETGIAMAVRGGGHNAAGQSRHKDPPREAKTSQFAALS